MTTETTLTPADLIYAAVARCPCGAGIAYPRDAKPYGNSAYWDCSAILTRTAREGVKHTDQLPFMYYEIKSENQPSANGASTRPTEDAQAILDREYAEAVEEYNRIGWLLGHNAKKIGELETEQISLRGKLETTHGRLRAAHKKKSGATA